jgi:hypothetical protein
MLVFSAQRDMGGWNKNGSALLALDETRGNGEV